jgi:hypothetical protein
LTTKGFLAQYGRMAQIAALMGLAMLLLAALEGLAQGNAGLLARVVLINLPLAFIATSVAYAVVQLLLVATDRMCHAIATASHDNSEHFFKAAITGLGETGGEAARKLAAPEAPTPLALRPVRRRGRSACRCSSLSWRRSSAPSPPSWCGLSC